MDKRWDMLMPGETQGGFTAPDPLPCPRCGTKPVLVVKEEVDCSLGKRPCTVIFCETCAEHTILLNGPVIAVGVWNERGA
jgi:hypothetical protein